MHHVSLPLHPNATTTARSESDDVLYITLDIHPAKRVPRNAVHPPQDVFLQPLVNRRVVRDLAHTAQDDAASRDARDGVRVLRTL